MQIGEELCDRYLKGNYQYVLAIHTDKQHTHLHVIFNNTNLYNGLSFTTEHNQGKKTERAWAELRQISDDICKERGISIIEPKGKGVSHFERDMQIEGKSWKDKLRAKIAEQIEKIQKAHAIMERLTEKKKSEKSEITTPMPKPAEVKVAEKKEDVWAAIKGMSDADRIIADLEAGGIKSLSELRGFFWNIHHKDDHTANLADLKKNTQQLIISLQ